MIKCASTAGSDDRDFDGFTDSSVECIVEASLSAVAIHAGEEDFTCSKGDNFFCPFDGVEFGFFSAAVCVNLPLPILFGHAFGVDRDNDTLVTKA